MRKEVSLRQSGDILFTFFGESRIVALDISKTLFTLLTHGRLTEVAATSIVIVGINIKEAETLDVLRMNTFFKMQ